MNPSTKIYIINLNTNQLHLIQNSSHGILHTDEDLSQHFEIMLEIYNKHLIQLVRHDLLHVLNNY